MSNTLWSNHIFCFEIPCLPFMLLLTFRINLIVQKHEAFYLNAICAWFCAHVNSQYNISYVQISSTDITNGFFYHCEIVFAKSHCIEMLEYAVQSTDCECIRGLNFQRPPNTHTHFQKSFCL